MSPLLLYVCVTVFLIKGLCACSALIFLRFFHMCGDYKFRVYTPGNSSWVSWTPPPPHILEHTHSSPPPIFYSEAFAGGKANRQSFNSAVVRHGRAAVWAYLLAGKLHLTSPCSSSSPSSFSFCPSLPPSVITLTFPSGGPATPITLLLLPGRGSSHTHTHWLLVLPITRACPSLLGTVRYAWFCVCFFFPWHTLFAKSYSVSVSLSHSSFSFPRSPSLSQAARGTNWRPAELNVPGAESQMVLAEGWRERGMDATERWRAETVVWHGSVGEQALDINNLLALRGPKNSTQAPARGQSDPLRAQLCLNPDPRTC